MTLQERLARLHAEAARLYLQRQQIQSQQQHWARQAAECDRLLLQSDGAVSLMEQLIAESKEPA